MIARKQEMRERMEAMKNLTPEERKEAMNKFRENVKASAEENNIPFPFRMMHRNKFNRKFGIKF